MLVYQRLNNGQQLTGLASKCGTAISSGLWRWMNQVMKGDRLSNTCFLPKTQKTRNSWEVERKSKLPPSEVKGSSNRPL